MSDQPDKAPVVGIFVTFLRADGTVDVQSITVGDGKGASKR